MRFLKILGSDFMHESRDERELDVVQSLGFEVCVLGRKTKNNALFSLSVDKAVWKEVNPLAPLIKNTALNRLFCQIPWALAARKMNADIISCHDIAYLFIGWLSTLGMKKKPMLVYDSHEFECERVDSRSSFLKLLIKHTERFLIKRCALSIMVNDSIADAVCRLHHLKDRPLVVRNIPENWCIDKSDLQLKRQEFLKENALPDDTFICMYHGVLSEGRGIENGIKALAKTEGTVLILLGKGSEEDKRKYRNIAKDCGVLNRLFFHNAVPHDELYKYVGMANVGLVIIENVCLSYYLSLPNKLFENIQSLTPVIGSDFPEIKRITDVFGVGLTVQADSVDDISAAILKMRNDTIFYERCKSNLASAKEKLCWENERVVLENAYKKLMKHIV
ncbi:MAG: glycosyltransferase [Bacteroidales bacterium]|nr:glycosyltransferase [Bacteroidales bacterium]